MTKPAIWDFSPAKTPISQSKQSLYCLLHPRLPIEPTVKTDKSGSRSTQPLDLSQIGYNLVTIYSPTLSSVLAMINVNITHLYNTMYL